MEMPGQVDALERIRNICGITGSDRPVVIVAAHPDDEVIGVGARMSRWSNVRVMHVTDGSPRDLRDARALGLATREEYVELRRAERARALAIAGVGASRIHDLGRIDQETSRDLVGLAAELEAAFAATQPDVVITHPYEGGHPDHDSTAFAVHAAARLLALHDRPVPVVAEMTSYHAADTGIHTGCFLAPGLTRIADDRIPDDARERKRAMMDCYASQHATLQLFCDCTGEPLRPSPTYRFTLPPHDGRLFYENFDWGISGPEWRALAREAASTLGLARVLA